VILSKLLLDWKSLKSLSIKGVYRIHKLIYSLFPGEKRSFLFYDRPECRFGKEILILSEMQPLLPPVGILQSKVIPDSFLENSSYAFQIMLNAVKRNSEGKLVPIIGKEEAAAWFLSKQNSWGFEVIQDSFEVFETGVQIFEKGETKITQSKASFRGVLRVTDRSVFKQSFEQGIGRGKAFGFGLLQLIKTN
jgi:CRISPR system Cascade subunit CasE